jgi:hypothetical protein
MGLHSENEVSYFWYKTGTDISSHFRNGVATISLYKMEATPIQRRDGKCMLLFP